MKTRCLGPLVGLVLLTTITARADGLKYGMSVNNPVIYEVTLTTDMPDGNKSVTGYLVYKPLSIDAANGQAKLSCLWGVVSPGPNGESNVPGFLSKAELAKTGGGAEISIDKLGNIVRIDSSAGKAQLGDALGPAGELMLQPLPAAGQTTWSTKRNISLYYEKKTQQQGGPPWGGGPWGRPEQITRIETPAEETVTYTAAPVDGGKQVIRRNYNLSSLEKTGDTPVHQIVGDGFYSFNSAIGAIESCEYKFTSMVNQKNVQVKIPITLSAKLVPADALTKMQEELAEREKKAQEVRAAQDAARAEHDRNITANLPQNMQRSELVGYHTEQGGDMVQVNPRGLPMIGVKYVPGDWMRHKAFRVFEAVFEEPKEKRDGEIYVLARDGFVVTSITVNGMPNNGTPGVPAIYLTFAKKNGDGIDRSTAYNSPWLGERVGDGHKTLGGNGKIVYGICGRHGLNLDNLGVVTRAGAATDEPAKDEPAKDEPAKDEPAKDEPAKDEPDGDSKIVNTIPAGMKKSDLAGAHPEQGGTMVQVNSRNLPMIGVKYVTGDFSGHKAFRVFEPVFEAPKDKKAGDVYVLAKDGYVVTSITVNPMPDNGTPGVPALYLTFAKLNGDKLDLTTQYNSPWLGERVGEARKTVGTRGQIVYGIYGRHGMNLDCLGVVIKSSPAK